MQNLIPGLSKKLQSFQLKKIGASDSEKNGFNDNGNKVMNGVTYILPYTKNEINQLRGIIFSDKRIGSVTHLSPSRNRQMHEDFA